MRLAALIALLAWVGSKYPGAISDNNSFLKGFVGSNLLSTLGFIISVTLASIANIHLQLSILEETSSKPLASTRRGLRLSAITLLVVFSVAFVISLVKPMFSATCLGQIAFNCGGVICVYICIEVMWDITVTTFKVSSQK